MLSEFEAIDDGRVASDYFSVVAGVGGPGQISGLFLGVYNLKLKFHFCRGEWSLLAWIMRIGF